MPKSGSKRRLFLSHLLAGCGTAFAWQAEKDWVCPMDPDYRSNAPGACPKCGMKLVLGIPERLEYPLLISQSPDALKPGDLVTIKLSILNPVTMVQVKQFQTVHEKLIHLFIVSENLEFFAHVHPVSQPDGSFQYQTTLPYPGMYRLLADFYPSGSVPQLAVGTLFVSGTGASGTPPISLSPQPAENLTVSLRSDPEVPIAGLETKLFFSLSPPDGIEPYLGAWAHMLSASSDLVDLLHLHPSFALIRGTVQFNVLFPRPERYRIWTQFQRLGKVNTVVFTIPVRAL